MNKLTRYSVLFCLGLMMAIPITGRAEVTSQQASELARQYMPGRVLAIKQVQHQGQPVYQIKILSERGEVHIVLISAANGRRLGN